jgi:DNA-directed RNA polymerase specialized sigma24 family protein
MDGPRDISSFEKFYRQHRSWSRALMRQILKGTGLDWEDPWNEAWTRFSQKYLDSDFVFRADPQGYLRRCFGNQAKSALRAHANGSPVELGIEEHMFTDIAWPSPDDLADLLEDDRGGDDSPSGLSEWQNLGLAAAISRLSPMQRAVILFWSQTEPTPTDKELGNEFGISRSAAKTHRLRALDNLRQSLGAASVDSPDV